MKMTRASSIPIGEAKNKIKAIDKQIEQLKRLRGTYEFIIGRLEVGRSVNSSCLSDNPDNMCATCNCWKKTREMCS